MSEPLRLLPEADRPTPAAPSGGNHQGPETTEAGPSHFNMQRLTHSYDPTGNRMNLQTWFGRLTYSYDARRALTGVCASGFCAGSSDARS